MNQAKREKRKRLEAERHAANNRRAKRPAPDFLGDAAAKDWEALPEASRIYIWRRLDELCAAPARREAKLAKSFGFANPQSMRAFQEEVAPFIHHAAARGMTLAGYLAFFAGNEAKARDGDVTGALRNLLAFIAIDREQLGRGMLSLWAALQLPRFNAALESIFAAFVARSIDLAVAVRAIAGLASEANSLGLALRADASRFDVAEAT